MRSIGPIPVAGLPAMAYTLREPTMREVVEAQADEPGARLAMRPLRLLVLCADPRLPPAEELPDLPLSQWRQVEKLLAAHNRLMAPETEPDPDAEVEEGQARPPG